MKQLVGIYENQKDIIMVEKYSLIALWCPTFINHG